jgi:hypothetical protein
LLKDCRVDIAIVAFEGRLWTRISAQAYNLLSEYLHFADVSATGGTIREAQQKASADCNQIASSRCMFYAVDDTIVLPQGKTEPVIDARWKKPSNARMFSDSRAHLCCTCSSASAYSCRRYSVTFPLLPTASKAAYRSACFDPRVGESRHRVKESLAPSKQLNPSNREDHRIPEGLVRKALVPIE